MKALILDKNTSKIVSMVYSQTQILEREVYLVELLGEKHDAMNHLKAVLILQPNEINVDLLIQEFRNPKFSEYHIFFTNFVSKDMLTRLGRADEHELVRQIHEYYADYLAINDDFFHLGIENSISLSSPLSRTLESSQIFDRNVNGILAVLLSLERRPSQVRYQVASELARRVTLDVVARIEKDDIFEFRRPEGPLLLILDRRDDPITPLLNQWTYQAMVHELLGLKNNRVVLRGAPGIKKDLDEVVLASTQDSFFAKHRYSNFGDLGSSVKKLLDDYQATSKRNENISTIEDMQAFLERYPEFRSQSINVSKHVAIISELARLTDKYQLLDISQLEQEISCNNDHAGHKKELLARIQSPNIQAADKLRLTLLFLIRYESYDEMKEFKLKLSEKNVPPQQLANLDALLDYAGETKRATGLFAGGGIISKIGKSIASSINGVENVYTQHQPALSYTLDSIAKGKLKDSYYPLLFGNPASRFSEIVVFIVGGATFEEATKVAEFNSTNQAGLRVILGGSTIHNSTSFLKEIRESFGR